MFEATPAEYLTPDALDFYTKNQHQAIDKLLFKHGKDQLKRAWISQIESRRRALDKLPEWHKTNKIVFPPMQLLQQASSEETAAYKANLMSGNTCADLTGGSGVDSWQIAKQFKQHFYVEPNAELIGLAKHNFEVLGLNNVNITQATAEDYLQQTNTYFDWIYLDPSRRREGGNKVFLLHDYQPNTIELLPELLSRSQKIMVKVSPMADISYLIQTFKNHISQIHVVAVHNSCKEILLILTKKTNEAPAIHTVNLGKTKEVFHYLLADEIADAHLAPTIEKYIFEPNAAVLKAGAFNSIAHQFNLNKLQKNSHLYTGVENISNFPGKIYEVLEMAAPFKLKHTYPGAEISVRNFNLKESEIRKKMKLKEHTNFRLFATQWLEKRCFIMTKKCD